MSQFGPVRSCRRWLALRSLAKTFHLRLSAKAYVDAFLATSNAEEQDPLCVISEHELLALQRFVVQHLGTAIASPRIPVLCLSTELDDSQPSLRKLIPPTRACWNPRLGMVVIRLGESNPPRYLRALLVHELTHGLIDFYTAGFRFLPAIEEGLAEVARWTLPDRAGISLHMMLEQERPTTSGLSESQCMTITELLAVRRQWLSNRYSADDREFARKVYTSSLWFACFVGILAKHHPELQKFYETIWRHRLRTPDQVFAVLKDTARSSDVKIERAFRVFCTTRQFVHPDES